MVVYFDLFLLF